MTEQTPRRWYKWPLYVSTTTVLLLLSYFAAYYFAGSLKIGSGFRGSFYAREYSYWIPHRMFVPAGWLEAKLLKRHVILRSIDARGSITRPTSIRPDGRITHFED